MIEEIKSKVGTVVEAARLLGDPLEPNAKGFCLCPFHDERSPSFHLYDDGKRFKCFGCGEAGDAIDFWTKRRGESAADGIRSLAEACGVEADPRPRLVRPQRERTRIAVADAATDEDSSNTEMNAAMLVALHNGKANHILRWAHSKGILPRTIRNEARAGRMGLAGSRLVWLYQNGAKVRGTLESSRGDRWLRGQARGSVWGDGPTLDDLRVNTVWLTEGETDRLRLMQEVEGPRDVVLAIPGASQEPGMAMAYRIGGHRNVVLCFDGDDAGRKATAVWTEALADADVVVDMDLPEGEDVCALAPQGLERKIEQARKKLLRFPHSLVS